MSHLRVLEPGFLSTVQDLGRFGFAHLGVSPCGAADSLSFRAVNRLLGNPDGAPAIEMTLRGGAFLFSRETVFALAGADFDAALDGRPVDFWQPACAPSGARLEIGSARTGARCYLAISGGILVDHVMGSASTDLRGGFGGCAGRALRTGDILSIGPSKACPAANASRLARLLRGPLLRITSSQDVRSLCSSEFTVREDSNRLGIRLSGPALPGAELVTEGVSLGAVQVPPNGQPIILFVDQQTTGGYTRLANVISADFPKLGQLRPRDPVRFEQVDYAQALRALRALEEELP